MVAPWYLHISVSQLDPATKLTRVRVQSNSSRENGAIATHAIFRVCYDAHFY